MCEYVDVRMCELLPFVGKHLFDVQKVSSHPHISSSFHPHIFTFTSVHL